MGISFPADYSGPELSQIVVEDTALSVDSAVGRSGVFRILPAGRIPLEGSVRPDGTPYPPEDTVPVGSDEFSAAVSTSTTSTSSSSSGKLSAMSFALLMLGISLMACVLGILLVCIFGPACPIFKWRMRKTGLLVCAVSRSPMSTSSVLFLVLLLTRCLQPEEDEPPSRGLDTTSVALLSLRHRLAQVKKSSRPTAEAEPQRRSIKLSLRPSVSPVMSQVSAGPGERRLSFLREALPPPPPPAVEKGRCVLVCFVATSFSLLLLSWLCFFLDPVSLSAAVLERCPWQMHWRS